MHVIKLFCNFNVISISDQSIADIGSSNTTRLSLLMPMACQEFVFWVGEGYREKRKKER